MFPADIIDFILYDSLLQQPMSDFLKKKTGVLPLWVQVECSVRIT